MTSPVTSSVLLVQPRRKTARYSFLCSCTKGTSRVAAPTHTTSTPVAIGSSVPACPAFAGLTSLATRSTTSRDESPAGLSMFNNPCSGFSAMRRFEDVFGCNSRRNRLLSYEFLKGPLRPAHSAALRSELRTRIGLTIGIRSGRLCCILATSRVSKNPLRKSCPIVFV